MTTGFEKHSTQRLMEFSFSLLTHPANRIAGEDVQILARITAELASRLQRLEERV